MIVKLTGKIDRIESDGVVIDVAGVGYWVQASRRCLSLLDGAGAAVSLPTTQIFREDGAFLYGFVDREEQGWFRLLTTVQGVGAKVALAMLSVLSPDQLATAIAAQDKTALCRADGVGPKLGQRIVTELKDKAGAVFADPILRPVAAVNTAPVAAGVREDAVSALVNLGYGRSEAFSTVSRLMVAEGEAVGLSDLIRRSLKELAA
jgi:Holliday junction DNA helicase RuvA